MPHCLSLFWTFMIVFLLWEPRIMAHYANVMSYSCSSCFDSICPCSSAWFSISLWFHTLLCFLFYYDCKCSILWVTLSYKLTIMLKICSFNAPIINHNANRIFRCIVLYFRPSNADGNIQHIIWLSNAHFKTRIQNDTGMSLRCSKYN